MSGKLHTQLYGNCLPECSVAFEFGVLKMWSPMMWSSNFPIIITILSSSSSPSSSSSSSYHHHHQHHHHRHHHGHWIITLNHSSIQSLNLLIIEWNRWVVALNHSMESSCHYPTVPGIWNCKYVPRMTSISYSLRWYIRWIWCATQGLVFAKTYICDMLWTGAVPLPPRAGIHHPDSKEGSSIHKTGSQASLLERWSHHFVIKYVANSFLRGFKLRHGYALWVVRVPSELGFQYTAHSSNPEWVAATQCKLKFKSSFMGSGTVWTFMQCHKLGRKGQPHDRVSNQFSNSSWVF